MKELGNRLAGLLEVRKMVTLMFAGVFCYLAIANRIEAEYILSILTMVFGYYFGRSNGIEENKTSQMVQQLENDSVKVSSTQTTGRGEDY